MLVSGWLVVAACDLAAVDSDPERCLLAVVSSNGIFSILELMPFFMFFPVLRVIYGLCQVCNKHQA